MTSVSSAPVTATVPPPPAVSVPPPAAPAVPTPTTPHDGGLFDPDLFDKAYQKVRGMGDIQYDFPDAKPPEPPPEWLTNLVKSLGRMFEGLGQWNQPITWIIYAILALLALYILYRLFPAFRGWVDKLLGRVRDKGDGAEAWQPEILRAREYLEEADALAAEQRYAEAVHLLLWRSIEDIGRRRPKLLKPSLTARDIARSPDLPDAVRGAFTTIADVVELSLFGRRPVDRDGWERCRDAYSCFALRENWAVAKGAQAASAPEGAAPA